ncbi:TetR/AcrR family transcriptional regulator [Actinokineospora inagensis]|uniref:TetR/AcrR family transcriptional regulator n=1 Tax=Actinokineospora inagensis TaxID=103730 RepID=UPI0003FDA255|nr:TetR/AcrR family transcriptional regulator [Actinokineospora inagensis]
MADPAARRRKPADARATHKRILKVADAAFAEHGTGASLNEIAQRAKVGAGTLYRHFPNREALVAGLLADRVATLATQARKLAKSADAGTALVEWLHTFVDRVAVYRGASASIVDSALDPVPGPVAEMRTELAGLLKSAQEQGSVRAELTADDVLLLAGGITWVAERTLRESRNTARLIDAVTVGLRTH